MALVVGSTVAAVKFEMWRGSFVVVFVPLRGSGVAVFSKWDRLVEVVAVDMKSDSVALVVPFFDRSVP